MGLGLGLGLGLGQRSRGRAQTGRSRRMASGRWVTLWRPCQRPSSCASFARSKSRTSSSSSSRRSRRGPAPPWQRYCRVSSPPCPGTISPQPPRYHRKGLVLPAAAPAAARLPPKFRYVPARAAAVRVTTVRVVVAHRAALREAVGVARWAVAAARLLAVAAWVAAAARGEAMGRGRYS